MKIGISTIDSWAISVREMPKNRKDRKTKIQWVNIDDDYIIMIPTKYNNLDRTEIKEAHHDSGEGVRLLNEVDQSMVRDQKTGLWKKAAGGANTKEVQFY